MRQRLEGPHALHAALLARAPVRLVLVRRDHDDPDIAAVVDAARAAGVPVRPSSTAVLRRFSGGAPQDVLALVGPPLRATLPELMARAGAVWLLAGVRYPGNAGCAIRTAEVSGAAGIVLDSALFPAGRRAAYRASMRAERLFPVLWAGAAETLAAARAAGRRIVVLEDAGGSAPDEADLAPPVLLVAGGERDGVPREVLAAADERVCIPMAGFIPSYNVQAAIAVLATAAARRMERRDPARR